MSNNYITNSWLEVTRFNGIKSPVNFICDDPGAPVKNGYLNIFLHIEPPCILNIKKFLIDNQSRYDYILSHDNDVLSNCKNSRKFCFGSSWIGKQEYGNINVGEKDFKISTLIGQKSTAYGHTFRQKLLHRQKDIESLQCYRSINEGGANQYQNPMLTGSKFELFRKYQYSIVIENCSCPNWFSEKLIDCLICKTIPIYYGDPQIGKLFNTSGWIVVENDDIDIMKAKISGLTADHYMKHMSVIEENYSKAVYYADFYENVNRVLREINKEIP